ncbi:13290_t:CDS:2 [Acaulospora colombiana]|uniref:13290_t:CDS:1 n=1 Tax=Acaulospora colombiana TaxID=27376 RepID=A0ACA9JVV7_9GLOM|nr:13290_t:CDS:2 [Acaulospora colombiana]
MIPFLGARCPSAGDIRKFDVLDKLFENASLSKDWQRSPFGQSQASLLTQRGERELYLLGKRSRKRYSKFWSNITYDANVVEFKSTQVSRYSVIDRKRTSPVRTIGDCLLHGLAHGLRDIRRDNVTAGIHTLQASDEELLMHHACPLWTATVENSSVLKEQVEIYIHTHLSKIARRISNQLGIRPPLEAIHAEHIYRACSYAVTYSGRIDTWCSLLEEEDFLKLEYLHDMIKYYGFSYGSPLNARMACQFYTGLVKSVDDFLDGKSSIKSMMKFAHAETIIFLTTILGLFKDDYPLDADRFYRSKSRKFRTSKIAPFASNIYFEIYNCTDNYESTIFIQMLVNEKPVVIPGCVYTFCSWDRFKQLLGSNIGCDFDEMCKL